MNLFRIASIVVLMFGFQTFAQHNDTIDSQPQLIIQQSNYVGFRSYTTDASGGAFRFNGKFIVSGEGIYGHFDLVGYDQYGKIVLKAKTDDRAYRRDQGGKMKSVELSTSS
jgi:hypothetical protein